MHVGFSLAAAVAFMFLIWHDTLRGGRTSRLHYAIRSVICGVVALVIFRKVIESSLAQAGGWISILAIATGVIASLWFLFRALGWQKRPREEEPLPTIFPDSDSGPRDG